jgi:hypothetical protein
VDGTKDDLLWQDEVEAEVVLSGECSPKLKFLIENFWSSYVPSHLVHLCIQNMKPNCISETVNTTLGIWVHITINIILILLSRGIFEVSLGRLMDQRRVNNYWKRTVNISAD